jgi:hypothetical protein
MIAAVYTSTKAHSFLHLVHFSPILRETGVVLECDFS